ncbi:MAG: acyltransferase family protein [Breznakia sp.]
MEAKKYYGIDVVRIFCVIVLIMAATQPFSLGNDTLNYFVVNVLGNIALPFIFVASTFSMFKKLDFSLNLYREKNFKVFRNYIFRLLRIYLVYSFIYIFALLPKWLGDGMSTSLFTEYLTHSIFYGSYAHLWIFPALIFAVTLVYMLIGKVDKKYIFIGAIGCYIVASVLNVYGSVFMEVSLFKDIARVYGQFFVSLQNGLFYGFIYAFIGYFVAVEDMRFSNKMLLPRLAVSFVLLFVEVFFIRGIQLDPTYISMYVMVVPFTFYFFIYTTQISLHYHERYITFRNMTTLMYVAYPMAIVVVDAVPITILKNPLIIFITVMLLANNYAYIVYKLSLMKKYWFFKVLY